MSLRKEVYKRMESKVHGSLDKLLVTTQYMLELLIEKMDKEDNLDKPAETPQESILDESKVNIPIQEKSASDGLKTTLKAKSKTKKVKKK